MTRVKPPKLSRRSNTIDARTLDEKANHSQTLLLISCAYVVGRSTSFGIDLCQGTTGGVLYRSSPLPLQALAFASASANPSFSLAEQVPKLHTSISSPKHYIFSHQICASTTHHSPSSTKRSGVGIRLQVKVGNPTLVAVRWAWSLFPLCKNRCRYRASLYYTPHFCGREKTRFLHPVWGMSFYIFAQGIRIQTCITIHDHQLIATAYFKAFLQGWSSCAEQSKLVRLLHAHRCKDTLRLHGCDSSIVLHMLWEGATWLLFRGYIVCCNLPCWLQRLRILLL